MLSRLVSAVRISIKSRRRASSPASSRVADPEWSQFGFDGRGELRQHLRIQPIRLGQPTVALAKSRTWRGLTASGWQCGAAECRERRRAVATGRLEHDAFWTKLLQSLDEELDASFVIGDLPAHLGWLDGHVQAGLADIDTDLHRLLGLFAVHRRLRPPQCPYTARPCRYELITYMAGVTVRARHRDGEATVLENDLGDHRARGLPRRLAFHHLGGTPLSHTRAPRPGPRRCTSSTRWHLPPGPGESTACVAADARSRCAS